MSGSVGWLELDSRSISPRRSSGPSVPGSADRRSRTPGAWWWTAVVRAVPQAAVRASCQRTVNTRSRAARSSSCAADTALFQQCVQGREQIQIQLHGSNSTSEKHALVVNRWAAYLRSAGRDRPPASTELREPTMTTPMPFDAGTTLMSEVTAAVKAAGVTLRDRYTPQARGVSLDEVVDEIHANDDAVLDVLREPLLRARQGSQWAEDELAGGALPPGEWWV